jgi:molybdopterin molybdotransferase
MLSVADAFTLTQQHLLTLPTETVSIDEANGRVLREAVLADRDFPPFDRVAMDGICIRSLPENLRKRYPAKTPVWK